MKILNSTTRDTESPIQKTPVSDLPTITQLKDESLIHIVDFIKGNSTTKYYQSSSMTCGTLKQKLYEAVNNTLKTGYWDTHLAKCTSHTGNATFNEILAYLLEIMFYQSRILEPI